MAKTTKKSKKKAVEKNVSKGRMYITSTFNNTLVSITDQEGNVVCSGSSGSAGFKGARRATPYAATKTVMQLLDEIRIFQTKELEIYLKGAGMGRDAALRALKNSGIKLTMIADITPIPHNGVRPKKKRRIQPMARARGSKNQ